MTGCWFSARILYSKSLCRWNFCDASCICLASITSVPRLHSRQTHCAHANMRAGLAHGQRINAPKTPAARSLLGVRAGSVKALGVCQSRPCTALTSIHCSHILHLPYLHVCAHLRLRVPYIWVLPCMFIWVQTHCTNIATRRTSIICTIMATINTIIGCPHSPSPSS